MKSVCYDFISLIDNTIMPWILENPNGVDQSQQLQFILVKGDYYRYACEFESGDMHSKMCDRALEAYSQGMLVAENLHVVNPIRLK